MLVGSNIRVAVCPTVVRGKSPHIDALLVSWARLRRLGLSDKEIEEALQPLLSSLKGLA